MILRSQNQQFFFKDQRGLPNLIYRTPLNEIRDTEAYRVVGDLATSDLVVNNTFWVGVYPGMTDDMVDYMAEVIKKTVSK